VAPRDGGEDAKLRAAILSVHAYVEEHRVRGGVVSTLASTLVNTLGAIPRMELGEAIQVIKGAQDESAKPRIQRSVVRLLAHTRHKPETIAAVKELIGPEKTVDLLAKVNSAIADDPTQRPEQVVSNAYALMMGPQSYRNCSEWTAWSDDAMDPSSNDISIVVTAEGKPSLYGNVRKGLDPQSWGGCSRLWKRTNLAKMQGGQPVLGADGKPMPDPKTLGDAWGAATLYEEFVCDDTMTSPPCDIALLLDVKALWPTASSYYVSYETPRHFPAPPSDPNDVWVVTDHGSVKATKNGNRVDIKSSKVFGFTNKTHTLMVLAWLYAIEEQSYLGDLACCF
jgi:hypothetical protein